MRTLDPRTPTAAALAVDGGRIVALGSRTAVLAAAGRALRIDCDGRTILPGLIDPHLHLFGLAARGAELDCRRFTRARDVVAAVGRAAAGLPADEWVRGAGLDDTRLDRLPTAAELERAAPRHPVRLRHRSRHASVLNRRALARLGRIEGVVVERGRPTGLVAGAEAAIGRAVGRLPAATIEAGLVEAGHALARVGITTVADATPHAWGDLAPLRRVVARDGYPVRVVAMRRPGSRAWRGTDRLRPGAVKILVEEGPRGLDPDPAALAATIERVARDGAQIAIHCVGMGTLVATLAAFAALPSRARRGRRHRLEHLAECPPSCVPRIAALDLVVVTNPAFVYRRGDAYRHETTSPRAWLYRARSLLAAGIALAGASDAPVVEPSPWTGMAAARRRRTAGGARLGSGEAVTGADALGLFTTGAAWALRADDLGRLWVGGPADLVVVDRDPVYVRGGAPGDPGVWMTVANGEITWHA